MANDQSLKLSGPELKAMTGWPDALVYEFLSLESSVSEITQNINIVINNVTTALTLESQTGAGLATLKKSFTALQNQMAAFDTLPSKVSSLKAALLRLTNANAEQAQAVSSLVARLQVRASAQADQITLLNEQGPVPNYTLLSRLSKESEARMTLAQEFHGG